MTRINLVDPTLLNKGALSGEWHELPRVITLAKNAYWGNRIEQCLKKAPEHFTLGTGHVLWFYDKLGYIFDRYKLLAAECIRRGWDINVIPEDELLKFVPKSLLNNWIPSDKDVAGSMQRLIEKKGLL